MKQFIKDLGGAVNKDLGFSKVKQDVVYDSQNFRITPNDDGTFVVRTNIRGNENILTIPDAPTEWQIKFNDSLKFIAGNKYRLILQGQNFATGVTGSYTFDFDYVTETIFYQELVGGNGYSPGGLNGQALLPTSFLYGSISAVSPTFDYLVISGNFTSLTILSVTQLFPAVTYGELVINGNFSTNPLGTWTYILPWTWDNINNKMDAVNANGETLQQVFTTLAYGQLYTVEFDVTITSGDMLVLLGYPDPNQTSTPLITATGSYSYDLSTLSLVQTLTFFPGNNFTGSIDNVSIKAKEFTGFIDLTLVKPAQQNLRIIGWTTLRDDIILITTNGVFNPDDPATGPFTSYGQIWRLTYDKGGNLVSPSNYNLTLLYNDQLNLTVYRPIANPGMIETRYENPSMTPIYWTDNYNTPRRANLADPELITLTPEALALLPSLSLDIPILTKMLDGGNLRTGTYQIAYRLKTPGGTETRFSRFSKMIPIIDAPETSSLLSYYPIAVYDPLTGITSSTPSAPGQETGANANKSIEISISNLDTNYTTIEIVTLYYNTPESIPECHIVKTDAIPPSGTYISVIDSSDNDIPITIDELTAFSASIVRCKTLATKAQTLFLGNLKTTDLDFEFDTRTYRFPINSTTTKIKSTTNVEYTIRDTDYKITQVGPNPVVPFDVPEDFDCIQDYDSQAPDSFYNNLYLPNSEILGGEGPNIKYVFITENMLLDSKVMTQNVGRGAKNVDRYTTTITGVNGVTFENVNSFQNNSSPFLYDTIVGYRRDEMERIGIVFFDQFDNPSYVSWIGDIRFPHQFMVDPVTNERTTLCSASHQAKVTPNYVYSTPEGPILFKSTVATCERKDPASTEFNLIGNIMGLRITIKNFTGIPSSFKKCGIVRVPKKETDRRIIAQGFVRPTYKNYGGDSGDENWLFTNNIDIGGISPCSLNYEDKGWFWPDVFSFVSPEFLFNVSDPNVRPIDKLDIVGTYRKTALKDNGYLWSWIVPNDGGTWNGTKNDDNNEDNYWGFLTKNYYIEDRAFTPGPVKMSNSNNPYIIRNTFNIPNKVTQGIAFPNSNLEDAYSVGVVLPIPPFTNPRTIYNCSIKYPNANDWISTNANCGNLNPSGGRAAGDFHSHGNNMVLLQLGPSDVTNFNSSAFGGHNYMLNVDKLHQHYEFGNAGVDIPDAKGLNGYMANYVRNVQNQYGGNSFSDRASSEYVSTNCIIDISDRTNPITTKVLGGDTTVEVMDYKPHLLDQSMAKRVRDEVSGSDNESNLTVWFLFFPCETSVAIDYRRTWQNVVYNDWRNTNTNRSELKGAFNYNSDRWYDSGQGGYRPYMTEFSELFNVSPVFNYYPEKKFVKYFPRPYKGLEQNIFDCRVWKSEKKIDGAVVDAWSIFKSAAILDVESKYGPINNLVVFQNKMLYFQDKAFGQLQINEQKLINSVGDTTDLVLGSSGILERYDYISTQTGTKHQFSMSVSDYSLIWFDTLARKIYKFGDGLKPVTDLKGYHALLYNGTEGELQNNDNPYLYKGVHSTYDYRFNEFYMTFLSEENQFTLVYNDMIDGFVGEYTHYPVVYINDKSNIFSVPYSGGASEIYIHNYGNYGQFYGVVNPSKLSFVVNPEQGLEKVFTNMEVTAESFKTVFGYDQPDFNDFFDTMRVYDNYQNTDFISTSLIAKKHKTIWDVKIPSDRVLDVTQPIFNAANLSSVRPALTRRMKDKWFMVDFIYNNTDNNKFVVHFANALYMINSR